MFGGTLSPADARMTRNSHFCMVAEWRMMGGNRAELHLRRNAAAMLEGDHLTMSEHEQLDQVPTCDYDNSRARALPVTSIQDAVFYPPMATAGKATGILQLCKPLEWPRSRSIIDLH